MSKKKIVATIENGTEYDKKVVKVKLMGYNHNTFENDEIASGNWSNEGFTIDLPAMVDTNYIFPIYEDKFSETLTISKKDAKHGIFYIAGYDKDDNDLCYFEKSKEYNDFYTQVRYVYSDSDVKISGYKTVDKPSVPRWDEETGRYIWEIENVITIHYSATLRKGWNIVYWTENRKDVENEKFTTNTVTGLKWYGKIINDEDE